MVSTVPINAMEKTSVEMAIENYMLKRENVLIFGDSSELNNFVVTGIVFDENKHYNILTDENIRLISSQYEIISINESDTNIEVALEETITYEYEQDIIKYEDIMHDIVLMKEEDELVVVSDAYKEEISNFVSASYVLPYDSYAAGSGSKNCVVSIAKSQIGYYEKASNSSLDSFTANVGSNNYTKYGKWIGQNPAPWCASFVSWCANQAQVSTSIITKTASCDVSMQFFKNNGRFYSSSAYGGTYRPQAGDIFFTGPNSGNATHTGIVVSISGSTITYIDGNGSGDVVKQRTMSWSNTSLLGFGHPAYASDTHTWINKTSYYQCSICGETSTYIPIAP